MRTTALLLILQLLVLSPARGQVPGLPDIDFKRYFPHILAISEVQKDPAFPNGFQYKFITVRDEDEKVVYLALTRREGPDRLVRLYLAKGPIENSAAQMRERADSLGKKLQIKFEIVDLRAVSTPEDFRSRATGMGWELEAVPK